MAGPTPRIVALGDAAVLAEFSDTLDLAVNARIQQLAAAIRARPPTDPRGLDRPILPGHLEQALTAQRVEKLGIGFIASAKADPALLARCWQGVEPGAPAHARATKLAARYPTLPGAGTHAEILSRVESLLRA